MDLVAIDTLGLMARDDDMKSASDGDRVVEGTVRIAASGGHMAEGAKIQAMRVFVLTVLLVACGNGGGGGGGGGGDDDLAVREDLGLPDLTVPADLSGGDLAQPDLAMPDLRPSHDLTPEPDLTPAPDLTPPADMLPPADLLQCIARGETCTNAGECCGASGCQTFAVVGKRCCGGLGATGCDSNSTGEPCCPIVPSGPNKDRSLGCFNVASTGSSYQCCIRSFEADGTCPSGQRIKYRCSDAGALINGECF